MPEQKCQCLITAKIWHLPSYPAVVGRDGVVAQLQLDLTATEQEKLATSAKYIKDRVKAEEQRAASNGN